MFGGIAMESNYDKAAQAARKLFIEYDQNRITDKFSLKNDEKYIYVNFFSRTYRIDRTDGEMNCPEKGGKVTFNEYLSIFDALCYSTSKPALSGQWAPVNSLGNLKNGVRNEGGFYKQYTLLFEDKPDKIQRACEKMNGIKADKGDIAYILPVFDFFPMYFRFWYADEDFPAQMNFLWDTNAPDFVHYETLWYIASALCERIKEEL